MFNLLVISVALFSSTILAFSNKDVTQEEFEEAKDRVSRKKISIKYNEGANLIYDCDEEHLACVDEWSNARCLIDIDTAKKLRQTFYNCKQVKEFKTASACNKYLQEKIETTKLREFCR